jgi:hypothetical protein
MNLSNLIKNLLNLQKKVDTKLLPSQGLFYKEDFEIQIKKADGKDVVEYEHNYKKDNLGEIIKRVKKIVESNIILPHSYSFNDLKSIDIIFLFLEIVKLTKGKPISLSYFDEEIGVEDSIEFNSSYFNYFNIDNKIMESYNSEQRLFIIDGYKYSLPSIGAENCLTSFLIHKTNQPNAVIYNTYYYDFTHFLDDKNFLTFKEIENLIQVFNFDIEESELKKVKKITKIFSPLQKYSLVKNGKIIEINSKIDLEKIWK